MIIRLVLITVLVFIVVAAPSKGTVALGLHLVKLEG